MTRPSSITLRLALLFGAASAVVLVAVGLLVGTLVEMHFRQLDIADLNGYLALIRYRLSRIDTPRELGEFSRFLGDALIGQGRLSVAIVSPDGLTLFATSGPGYPQPLLEARRAANSQPENISKTVVWSHNGHTYRGITATVVTAIKEMRPVTVAVALEIDAHEQFMKSFHEMLWAGVALAILVMAVLSWVAARYGLAPVRAMAQIAEGISATRLNDRLPLNSVPKELAGLAKSFNAMLGRLEDSFRRLSEFSSDLAHELRTPIGNLMTQTQVALSQARTPDQYREVLYSSLDEHARLARMISDMLFLAKADNGLAVPRKDSVDLANETKELFEFYDALAEEQGVKLAMSGEANVPGEKLMIRRAISNLLSNAIRYTPRGEIVTVAIERLESNVRLRVSNPGMIPPEHLARVFERFYRADPARERTSEGAGLGLAITKSILQAHGGSVAASSADGMVHFDLLFPAV